MFKVEKVLTTVTKDFPVLHAESGIEEVIECFKQMDPLFRSVFVTNNAGEYAGIIPLVRIMKGLSLKQGGSSGHSSSVKSLFQLTSNDTRAIDLAVKVKPVKKTDSLQDALIYMADNKLDELPVTDEDNRITGHLSIFELLRNM